jgi:FlaA1/EpsC-like NDP-sugar epimerase
VHLPATRWHGDPVNQSHAKRKISWLSVATVAIVPVLVTLVVLDVANHPIARWFDEHDFTTSVLTGTLVLLFTVLVINRIVERRRLRDHSTVIAAQATVCAIQAQRTATLVRAALKDSTQREAALGEARTYMTMLLTGAPVLIDATSSRTFLEQAQRLGAIFLRALRQSAEGKSVKGYDALITTNADRLRELSAPIAATLNFEQLLAVGGDEDDEESEPDANAS